MAVPQLNITERILCTIKDKTIVQQTTLNNCNIVTDMLSFYKNLPHILKLVVINHIAQADTPLANTCRGEHLPIPPQAHKDYFKNLTNFQNLNEEHLIAAVGEIFQFNIIVTSIYNDLSKQVWCLYLESETEPNLHFYKIGDIWTNSDISCFNKTNNYSIFDTIAKSMYLLATSVKTPLKSNSIFKCESFDNKPLPNESKIKFALKSALLNQQLPVEKNIAYLQEKQRIQNLSEIDKKEIINEYILTLDSQSAECEKNLVNSHFSQNSGVKA